MTLRIHTMMAAAGRLGRSSILLTTLLVGPLELSGAIEARIKDIGRIDGLNDTELIGYGVVVGLSGTGDKDIELTKRTMANILQNFQIALPSKDIKSKNVAAVMVTGKAPYFHQKGDRVDIQVSSVGDATSLEGGILLMAPLLDADGKLYALAQGSLTVGGYSTGVGGPGGQTQTKNYTTVGRIPSGATLAREQKVDFIQGGRIRFVLRHPDFTTAGRIMEAVNARYENSATAVNAGCVLIRIPETMQEPAQAAVFLADLEAIRVTPDIQSRIIVNERTGTIVMGGDVRVSEAIVAHGNLTVNIGSTLTAYMPNSLTKANPVVTEAVELRTKEDPAKVLLLPGTATVRDLADLLNQLGTTPRDMISILEALHSLGAIQMEVITI
ncbi:MAG: flagellar basal body P-ring protein FlgI [bacterium]